jgi:hypothetical protein
MDKVFSRPYKVSPHFSVITHMFYSMARFRMLLTNFFHYARFSDSLGIIDLPAKKVGLVNSFRSLISCTSPPDSCFEPHSLAGRT